MINSENKPKIDEFVDSDGSFIGNDRNPTSNSEIETGPTKSSFKDDTEYEKGISTTTNRAARYRQNIPWYVVYSYNNNRVNEKLIKKSELEEEILAKKSKDNDLINKEITNKVDKIIDTIDNSDLTKDEIEKIKKVIIKKIKNA